MPLGVGIILYQNSRVELAVDCWLRALKYSIDIQDKNLESQCYSLLGNGYYVLGDFHKAVEYHEKALQMSQGVHDLEMVLQCYIDLGVISSQINDFK